MGEREKLLSYENGIVKRSKVKLEAICDIENCKRAIMNASRRKRKRKSVAKYLENLDESARLLSEYIKNQFMTLHDGERETINEGTKKKKRELCKPRFFPDHCVHWAVMQIIGVELMKSYYKYSCASIKGRGTHYAKRAVEKAVKDIKGTKYCLQIDIKSFYATIDKEILIGLFVRKFKDKRIVAILAKIVRSYGGDGLPIGFYTSAAFANFYLTDADRYVKETLLIKYLVRYMDDMVMYDSSKRRLHNAKTSFENHVADTRKLKLKANWQVYKMPYLKGKLPKDYKERRRATDFVGYKFYRYKTTIRKSIFLRLRHCLLKLEQGLYNLKRAQSFMSYKGYLDCTDSVKVKQKYIHGGKINTQKLKEIIRDASKLQIAGGQKAAGA